MLVPFLCVGDKVLYLLVIEICDYGTLAPKRGELRAHVLNEDDLRETWADKADGALPSST
ncbi:hypothetical protein BG58_39420 [Caballeronia jiangsuensis]|nr:hypothetical protein BG58_39420 [Caballeronia jiangsuensis]